jgi:molecular chaperone DnaK
MYLGIDIGTSYTKLAVISDGKLIEVGRGEIIPTAAAYLPSTGKLYFGSLALRLYEPGLENAFFFKLNLKRYSQFRLGPYMLNEIIEQFLFFLYETYLLPTASHFESVSLSVPNYFGLNARQLLLNSARKVFDTEKVYLIPEPIAALIGFNCMDKVEPLSGAVLSIDIGGGTTDFSFIDAAGDLQDIMLEAQFQIGYDSFSGAELDLAIIRNIFVPLFHRQTGLQLPEKYITGKSLSPEDTQLYKKWLLEAEKLKIAVSSAGWAAINIVPFYQGLSISSQLSSELFLNLLSPIYQRLKNYIDNLVKERAQRLGLYNNGTWHLDYILLQGGSAQAAGVYKIIEDSFPDMPIKTTNYPGLIAAGLCFWQAKAMHNHISLKSIYPFDFYKEVYDQNGEHQLIKIPFDTANLGLDINGKYKIASLSMDSELPAAGEDGLQLRIYEIAQGEETLSKERFLGMDTVLNLKCPVMHNKTPLSLYLNLAESCLEINSALKEESVPRSGFLQDLNQKQQDSMQLIKNYKFIHPQLIDDFIRHLQQRTDNDSAYENYSQTLLFKLVCLLQILDNKS